MSIGNVLPQMTDSFTQKRQAIPALQMPQSVVVASTQPVCGAEVRALLKRSGLRTAPDGQAHKQPTLDVEDQLRPMEGWPDWLVDHPQSHLLLLVALPTMAVARLLADGVVPTKALAQWLPSAQVVLEVIRAQRRRVTLMFAEPALAAPQAFLDALSQRLQLQLEPVQTADQPPELPGALLRLMAENAIWQSSEARNIAAELEANALPLVAIDQVPAIDQVFDEYRTSLDSTARAARQLSEENELLLEQVQEMQQKIAALKAKNSAPAAENDFRIQDLREENELLLQQLYQVQEELEGNYMQGAQSSAELLQLQQRLQAAEATVQALYSSKSWKITKPLRVILDLFNGGSKTA